jgi:hypothetical protein
MAWAVWAVRIGLASWKGKEEGEMALGWARLAHGLCWAMLTGEGRVLVVLVGFWAVWAGSGYGPRGVLGKFVAQPT